MRPARFGADRIGDVRLWVRPLEKKKEEQQAGGVELEPAAPIPRDHKERHRGGEGKSGDREEQIRGLVSAGLLKTPRQQRRDRQEGEKKGQRIAGAVVIEADGAQSLGAGCGRRETKISDRAITQAGGLTIEVPTYRSADGLRLSAAASMRNGRRQSEHGEQSGDGGETESGAQARRREQERDKKVGKIRCEGLMDKEKKWRRDGEREGQLPGPRAKEENGVHQQREREKEQNFFPNRGWRIEHGKRQRGGREQEREQRQAPAQPTQQRDEADVEGGVEHELQRSSEGNERKTREMVSTKQERAEQTATHEAAAVIDEPLADDPGMGDPRVDQSKDEGDDRDDGDVDGEERSQTRG